MKLHLSRTEGLNSFSGYSAGQVDINGQRFTQSVLVFTRSIELWTPACMADLLEEHFSPLLAQRPEIVLFGTGLRQEFPHPRLTRQLLEARIGVEVMDTAAACRTFNILVAESRNVAAALLM